VADRTAGRLRYVFASEIVPDFKEPGLVDGILETKGMTIVYGPSGSGKTAVVVDLACRIAAGMKWHNCAVKQGLVIYIAAENCESTGRRIWAWMQRHEVDAMPFVLVKSPITLGGDAVKELRVLVKQVEGEAEEAARLVVFDTLARTFAGDENAAKDVGAYVAALDAVRDGINGHVLVVHHTGKDEGRGARGSSALKAATDHEIETTKAQDSRVGAITLTKIREGDLQGQRFGYELKPYLLGRNTLGREVTTPVIEDCAAPPKNKGMTAAQEAVEVFFEKNPGRVTLGKLKANVTLTNKGAGSSAERMAWKRLFDNGYLEIDADGFVTLT
jgi:hypothetical protein